eukprot:116783-Rhodomonas_salina.2
MPTREDAKVTRAGQFRGEVSQTLLGVSPELCDLFPQSSFVLIETRSSRQQSDGSARLEVGLRLRCWCWSCRSEGEASCQNVCENVRRHVVYNRVCTCARVRARDGVSGRKVFPGFRLWFGSGSTHLACLHSNLHAKFDVSTEHPIARAAGATPQARPVPEIA